MSYHSKVNDLKRRLERVKKVVISAEDTHDYSAYRYKPVQFLRDILKFTCTPQQEELCESLLKPPYRSLAISANKTGKSSCAARLALWWFSTRKPAKVVTTAPTDLSVKTIMWMEMGQAARQYLPHMKLLQQSYTRAPNDYMIGMTAQSKERFQGRHGPNLFFIFDEANGIIPEIFSAVETMFKSDGQDAWMCLLNPFNTTCQVYLEEMKCKRSSSLPPWHRIRISALDHPNVIAGLKNEPPPFPNAVAIGDVDRRIKSLSSLVGGTPDLTRDIMWPPEWATDYCQRTNQKPKWYRPGPECEISILGRWPTAGVSSVWSEGDWMMATREGMLSLDIPRNFVPHLGIDVAREGDDNTAIHVRVGPCSLHHEEHNGWSLTTTFERLTDIREGLLVHYRNWFNVENRDHQAPMITEFQIPMKVDDDGVGGGLVDFLIAAGYNVIPVNAQTRALESAHYVNRRSELWLAVAERSRFAFDPVTGYGGVDFSRLNEDDYPGWMDEAKRQATTPSFYFDARTGKRYVDPKDLMKEKLKRSPDTMDAVNLAYSEDWGDTGTPEVISMRGDPMRQMGKPGPFDITQQGCI